MPSGIGSRVATSTPVRGAILTAVRLDGGGQLEPRHGEDDEVVARMVASAAAPIWSTSIFARASAVAMLVGQAPSPTTAARRSGGSPPSHSHWSITFGQMRSVTAAASCGEIGSRPSGT